MNFTAALEFNAAVSVSLWQRVEKKPLLLPFGDGFFGELRAEDEEGGEEKYAKRKEEPSNETPSICSSPSRKTNVLRFPPAEYLRE